MKKPKSSIMPVPGIFFIYSLKQERNNEFKPEQEGFYPSFFLLKWNIINDEFVSYFPGKNLYKMKRKVVEWVVHFIVVHYNWTNGHKSYFFVKKNNINKIM